MIRASFIDFEDSFSFNLVQELVLGGFKVKVLNWKKVHKLPSSGLLVLGPGPGHPDEYESLYPMIKTWLMEKKPFFGVCLGHQIFWRLQGKKVERSHLPLHGQQIELQLDEEWKKWLGMNQKKILVQRYNSLAVRSGDEEFLEHKGILNFIQEGEILISRGKNVVTYQFHPESVGTSFRHRYIKVLHDIIQE